MLRPGSLLSRLLAVLLLGAALVGGHRLMVGPVLFAYDNGDRSIEQLRILLQRYHALAGQRGDLAERLAHQQQRRAAAAAAYLQGPSDALAAAQLQARVRSVVEAAGGTMRSALVLPADTSSRDGSTRRTALRVQFVAPIDGLVRALYELETGQPYVMIEQLTIRERGAHGRQPEAEVMLDVTLEMLGYVLAQAPVDAR